MTDESLVVTASIRDELTGPVEGIRREIKGAAEDVDALDRKASSAARGGLDRLSRTGSGLSSTMGRATSGIRAAGSGIGYLSSQAYRAGTYGLAKLTDGAIGATRWVGAKLYAAAKYGALGIGLLAGAAAHMGISTAANMETAQIAFSTMLGSGEKAKGFLSDLNKFAAATPFDFPGLVSASSSLISAGIDSKKVIPIMRTLGDVTSGMGTGAEGIQRATIAIQQMTAAGKIQGEDLNQLRDAGIPVYDLLSAATGKTKAEVVGLAQAGKLGADTLGQMMHALQTGEGLERFNGLMEKQSHTLTGVWSTLSDTVNMGLATALKPAVPILKDLVNYASSLAQKAVPVLTDKFHDLSRWYHTDGQQTLADFRDKAGELWDKVSPLAHDALPAMKDALHTIDDVIGKIAPKLDTVFEGFNNLPDWAKQAIVIGAGGAMVGSKLGLGSKAMSLLGSKGGPGSAGSGILGLVSKAKPMPVIIVEDLSKGGLPDVPGSADKKLAPWMLSLGWAAIPAIGGLAANAVTPESDKAAMAPALGGYAGDGGLSLPPSALNLAGDQTTATALTGSLSHAGADLAMGAKNAREFDLALQNLAHSAGPTAALQAFSTYADKVGFTQKALASAVPNFAAAMADWRGKAVEATLRSKVLNGIILGLDNNLDKVKGNRVATVRVDGLETATAGVANLIGSLGNLGNYTASIAGLSLPKREHGGSVVAGRAYVVGERRPEVFVPQVSGRIEPRVGSSASSGGVVIHSLTVNAQGAASDVDVERAVLNGIRRYERDRAERR